VIDYAHSITENEVVSDVNGASLGAITYLMPSMPVCGTWRRHAETCTAGTG